jgi:hypothetical protein
MATLAKNGARCSVAAGIEGAAHIKLRVIDGFVERLDLEALPWQVQHRVAALLAPLRDKTHLQ